MLLRGHQGVLSGFFEGIINIEFTLQHIVMRSSYVLCKMYYKHLNFGGNGEHCPVLKSEGSLEGPLRAEG